MQVNDEISPLHAAARAYARAGLAVFPIQAGGKRPAFKGSFANASTDLAVIDRWWRENPKFNIGHSPEASGQAIVDLDVKDGINGPAAWRALPGDKPATYTVATPSGGRHLYYRGSVRMSAGDLATGIDTRGRGSYVLLPPSRVGEGVYQVIDGREPAPLPAWILEQLGRQDKTAHAAPEHVEIDAATTIDWAKDQIEFDLVTNGSPQIGESSDERCFRLIGVLLDGPSYGQSLDRDTLGDLLHERWAPHFDREWIDYKLAACRYQNDPGCGPAGSNERKYGAIRAAMPETPPLAEEPPKPSRFRLIRPSTSKDRAPPTYWDDAGLVMRGRSGSVSLVFAAHSNYKTTWTANHLLATAKAKDIRVVYAIGEGTDGFIPLTLRAAIDSWNLLNPDDPMTWGWVDEHFQVIEGVPQLNTKPDLEAFIAAVQPWRPHIVVVDTLGRAAAGANLAAIEVGTGLGGITQSLAKTLGCDLILVHHATGERVFGSQFFENDADHALRLEHDDKKHVLTVAVYKDKWGERGRKVRFGTQKMTLTLADGSTKFFPATFPLADDDHRSESTEQAIKDDLMRKVYIHVRGRIEAGETVGRDNRSSYGPAHVAAALGPGVEQADVEEAMNRLQIGGQFVYTPKTKEAPSHWRLGAVQ